MARLRPSAMRAPSGPSRKAAQDRGVGRARAERVEDDAFADQFARDRLGEGDHAAFAGRVDRLARGADTAGVGGDVDDAAEAARRHALEHDVRDVERAVEIDGDDLAPEFRRGVEKLAAGPSRRC